jgi:hypothetical protein
MVQGLSAAGSQTFLHLHTPPHSLVTPVLSLAVPLPCLPRLHRQQQQQQSRRPSQPASGQITAANNSDEDDEEDQQQDGTSSSSSAAHHHGKGAPSAAQAGSKVGMELAAL